MNDKELTERTIKIIQAGGRILLRKGGGLPQIGDSYWYLHAHTNLAAGPDHLIWGRRSVALEMFDLRWAGSFAKLINCKVVVVYPKKKPQLPDGMEQGIKRFIARKRASKLIGVP